MKKLCTVLLLSAMFCTFFTACGKKAEEISSTAQNINALQLSSFETTREANSGLSFDVPKNWTKKANDDNFSEIYTSSSGDFLNVGRMVPEYTYASLIEEFKKQDGFADLQEETIQAGGKEVKIAKFKQTSNGKELRTHGAVFENGDRNLAFLLCNMNIENTDYTDFFKSIIQSIKVEQVYKASPTPEPTPKKTVYKAGMYKVGADIGAGEYFLTSTGSGYYSLNSDSSGSFDSILENDNFKNSAYITVSDGQYLELSNCTMIAAGDAEPQKPVNGTYPSGMYKVGYEIPAGEYKLKPTSSSGYYARLSKASSSLDAIIANDNFSGEIYLTIKDGEYLKLSNCVLIIQ